MFLSALRAIIPQVEDICRRLGVNSPDKSLFSETEDAIRVAVGEIHWEGAWVLYFHKSTGAFLRAEEEYFYELDLCFRPCTIPKG